MKRNNLNSEFAKSRKKRISISLFYVILIFKDKNLRKKMTFFSMSFVTL